MKKITEFTTQCVNEHLTMRVQVYENGPVPWSKWISWRRWNTESSIRGQSAAGRLYVNVNDESIMEQMITRRARPYNWYKKEIVPAVLAYLGLPTRKVSWTQHAGCRMCPCSPGFVFKDVEELRGHTIYVTILDGHEPKTVFDIARSQHRG